MNLFNFLKNKLKLSNLFENKHYHIITLLLITLIFMLLLFSFANLAKDLTRDFNKNKRIIGFIILDSNNSESNKLTNQDLKNATDIINKTTSQGLYSEQSYFVLYLMILSLTIGIFIIVSMIVFPRIKHLT